MNIKVLISIFILAVSCGGGGGGGESQVSSTDKLSASLNNQKKMYRAYVLNENTHILNSYTINLGGNPSISTLDLTHIEDDGQPFNISASENKSQLFVSKASSTDKNIEVFNLSKDTGLLTSVQKIKVPGQYTNSPIPSVYGTQTIKNSSRLFAFQRLGGVMVFEKSQLSDQWFMSHSHQLGGEIIKAQIDNNHNFLIWGMPERISLFTLSSHDINFPPDPNLVTPTISVNRLIDFILSEDSRFITVLSNAGGFSSINHYSIADNEITHLKYSHSSNSYYAGISYSSDYKFLIASDRNNKQIHSFSMNITSGDLVLTDTIEATSSPRQVKWIENTRFFLVADYVDNVIALYSIDGNGKLSHHSSIPTGEKPREILIL